MPFALACGRVQTRAPVRRASSAARGFSLLETMTVVAILSVVAALAVPNVIPTVVRQRHSGAAYSAAAFVARARQEAMSRRRCVRVTVGADGALVSEVENSFDCDAPDDTVRIDRTAPLYQELARHKVAGAAYSFVTSTARPTGEPAQLRFRPTGRLWDVTPTAGLQVSAPTPQLVRVAFAGSADIRGVVVEAQGLVCEHHSFSLPLSAGGPLCPR